MKRLYIFIFLVGLLGNNIMYAQIPASSQSLPSPNVAALGLYGEIPVSKFTGMPDISVPIYEVPVGDFKLPFSLHYHAAGIRPDQHPGWVGMGWNLNTGGVVSRTVKGKPDDCNVKNHTYLMNMGYYFHSEIRLNGIRKTISKKQLKVMVEQILSRTSSISIFWITMENLC